MKNVCCVGRTGLGGLPRGKGTGLREHFRILELLDCDRVLNNRILYVVG